MAFDVDLAVMDGIALAVMAGFEAIPVAHRQKSGLFLNILAGVVMAATGRMQFGGCAASHVGYQLITKRGFVFTPAIGIQYEGINRKIAPHLMLDVGVAF
jgi:uncharacterized membrane protein YeaQ/YmgE (transglycosylase-associated protein family)